MSVCEDCIASALRMHHTFQADCIGCRARAVARMPKFAESVKHGRQDRAYRALLEQADVTHDQVKAAAAADFMRRKPAPELSQETGTT